MTAYVNSDQNPSEITDFPFLNERNAAQMEKYGFADGEAGKWMMFIDKSELDAKWSNARKLYKSVIENECLYISLNIFQRWKIGRHS